MESISKEIRRRSKTPRTPNREGMPIRKFENKFFRFDAKYISEGYLAGLSKNSTKVYMVLVYHSNNETQTCFPSIERIMKMAGITNRNQVCKSTKELEKFGLIFVDRTKGRLSNMHYLLDPDVWRPIDVDNSSSTVSLDKP